MAVVVALVAVVLVAGVKLWDDMGRVRGLTLSTGERLQASAGQLSDDPDVQEATLAVAWQATCAVIFGDVRLEQGSIASAVLDAINQNANDAAAKCHELRTAGF